MGKNGISPGQIPHLVRLTADLFREMNKEIKSPNDNSANKLEENKEMHFVADLLSDLVDIAYPEEEPTMQYEEMKKELDIEFEKLAEVAENYVPPTEDKNLQRLINIINQGGEF